jgi:hypothetical protein
MPNPVPDIDDYLQQYEPNWEVVSHSEISPVSFLAELDSLEPPPSLRDSRKRATIVASKEVEKSRTVLGKSSEKEELRESGVLQHEREKSQEHALLTEESLVARNNETSREAPCGRNVVCSACTSNCTVFWFESDYDAPYSEEEEEENTGYVVEGCRQLIQEQRECEAAAEEAQTAEDDDEGSKASKEGEICENAIETPELYYAILGAREESFQLIILSLNSGGRL